MKILIFKKFFFFACFFFLSIVTTSCDMVLMEPQGLISSEQKKIILAALFLMLLIVIPVIAMTFLFCVQYRSSKNEPKKYWPDWNECYKIEFICWIFPIAIVFFLSVLAWKTTHQLDPYKPIQTDESKKPITIQVVSSDWKWIFIYPKIGIASVNEVVFPMRTPVCFKITSYSVMNSFFIPALGSQIYSMAGMQTQLNLFSNNSGIYRGFSSNYSGSGFSDMKFKVVVTKDTSDFLSWIKEVKKSKERIEDMSKFDKIARRNSRISHCYFSGIRENLYEDVIKVCMSKRKIY